MTFKICLLYNSIHTPSPVTLGSFGDQPQILGITNLDLFPLCSCEVELKTCKLQFETEPRDDQEDLPMFRKISFEVEMTSDVPLLQKPIANCFYISFDSIHNLKDVETKILVGFRPPTGLDVRNPRIPAISVFFKYFFLEASKQTRV